MRTHGIKRRVLPRMACRHCCIAPEIVEPFLCGVKLKLEYQLGALCLFATGKSKDDKCDCQHRFSIIKHKLLLCISMCSMCLCVYEFQTPDSFLFISAVSSKAFLFLYVFPFSSFTH